MDKKLVLICLASGITTAIIVGGLIFVGGHLAFWVSLFLPGFLFSIVLTIYYNDIPLRNKLIFILACTIIFWLSATTTFYLYEITNGITLLFFSSTSLLLTILAFDRQVRKLNKLSQSLTTFLTGGFVVGFVIFILTFIIRTKNNISLHEENIGLTSLLYIKLLLFPLWQTAFGILIREKLPLTTKASLRP